MIFSALPTWLKKDNKIETFRETIWSLTEKGFATDPNTIKKSANQAQILHFLKQEKYPVNESGLNNSYPRAKQSLLALEKKKLITKELAEVKEKKKKSIKVPLI